MENTKKKRKLRFGAFDIVNMLFLLLFAAACLFPFINILFTSFSTEVDYFASTIIVIPRHFTFEAYKISFWKGGCFTPF